MATITVNAILDHALMGYDLSPQEGCLLLKETDPSAIALIRDTADRLRQRQAGDSVTYVINRNVNFTNICEQHCSFCAFRRDEDQQGAYWLDWAQILAKVKDAVRQGATEICMQGGLNLQAKINGLITSSWWKPSSRNFPNCIYMLFLPKKCNLLPEKMDLS